MTLATRFRTTTFLLTASLALGCALAVAPLAGAAIPAAPPGCTVTTSSVASTGGPLAIPDDEDGELASDLTIPAGGTYVWDVDVTTNITHPYTQDLNLYLTSPAGTVVELATDRGGPNADVFAGVTWDDQSSVLVSDYTFTGAAPTTLNPEAPRTCSDAAEQRGHRTLGGRDDTDRHPRQRVGELRHRRDHRHCRDHDQGLRRRGRDRTAPRQHG